MYMCYTYSKTNHRDIVDYFAKCPEITPAIPLSKKNIVIGPSKSSIKNVKTNVEINKNDDKTNNKLDNKLDVNDDNKQQQYSKNDEEKEINIELVNSN